MISNPTGIEALALLVVVATALAFIARKTRQPTVTAYIVTGLLLGSVGLGIVSTGESLKLLSELGLAFLLFLVGMEIRLDEVREILKPTVVIAVSQMAIVGFVSFFTVRFLGFSQLESLFIAGSTMFSSTAVVVKLLSDNDSISTLPGRLDVGMLLIEDIAVILLLAIISTGAGSPAALAVRVGEVAAMIAAVASLSYLSSRYLLPGIFERISENPHIFFIHGVAWAFILVTVAQKLGISMEVGAFFAGLSIAQLPYSRELQERVRPLTDFLMAVFFINIGLQLNIGSFNAHLVEAVIASAVLIAVKFGAVFVATDRLKFTPETSFKASINKAQISEFALVMGAVGVSQGIVGPEILGFLSTVAIVTMGVSSYFLTYGDRIYRRCSHLLARLESEEKQDTEVERLEDHAVVIGYDELARQVLPVVKDYFETVVVVDRNPANTGELANSDYEYIYGDFKHGEMRNAASIDKSSLVISFSPENWVNRQAVKDSGEDTTVFVKADRIEEAADLYELGAHYVIVKNVMVADRMGDYLELYLEERSVFMEETEEDLQSISWGGRSG